MTYIFLHLLLTHIHLLSYLLDSCTQYSARLDTSGGMLFTIKDSKKNEKLPMVPYISKLTYINNKYMEIHFTYHD